MSVPHYYAVDPVSPKTMDRLLKHWDDLRRACPGIRSYALVDAAFDEQGVADLAVRHEGEALSLYAGTDMAEELAGVAPWLFELSDDPKTLAAQLRQFVALRGSRPMLTFLGSYRDIRALRGHFQPFLYINVQEDLKFLFRFADERVIQALIGVLSPEQESALWPGDLAVWSATRRDGAPAWQPYSPDAQRSPMAGPLVLDDKQFDALMDAAEPDVIITNLSATDPDRFNKGKARPADVYGFIGKQLERARAHGIQDTPNLETYCLAAMAAGSRFDEHAEFGYAITQAARQPGALAGLLAAVADAAWQQAREARTRA